MWPSSLKVVLNGGSERCKQIHFFFLNLKEIIIMLFYLKRKKQDSETKPLNVCNTVKV